MPQYITIKNFGPITSIEKMAVKDFMLFIGERATGKSTITKLIYFFKTFYEDVYEAFNEYFLSSDVPVIPTYNVEGYIDEMNEAFLERLEERLLKKLTDIFDYPENSDFELRFAYSRDSLNSVFISHNKVIFGNVIIEFTRDFIVELLDILTDNEELKRNRMSLFFTKLGVLMHAKFDTIGSFYIPSQRIFVSSEKDYSYSGRKQDDIIIRNYRNAIAEHRRGKNRKVLSKEAKNVKEIHNSYSERILKGSVLLKYNEPDIIVLENQERMPLHSASSGQQESSWILVTLQYLLSANTKSFVVIEEPESHLDPRTQSMMMESIVTFANRKEGKGPATNQVIITTHSPFILNTLGNILYASKLSKEHEEEREELAKLGFTPELLLDPERVAVYKCINGGVESIMEDGRVNNEEIDNISTETLNALDSLIDIELKHENEV